VRFRVIDSQGVIICQDSGEAVVVSDVGARILELMKDEATLRDIVDTLAAEYQVARSTLEKDAVTFADELIACGVIETRS
jgi:tartrate dehydratase alpha subunit/fumarate hydratase class I-like protein